MYGGSDFPNEEGVVGLNFGVRRIYLKEKVESWDVKRLFFVLLRQYIR